MAKTNPIRWSTQFTDDETDLVSYLYRYYSPIAGRWLSRDPVEERGGLNLYGFVGQNPVCTTDRLGLFRDDWMTCPCRCVSVTVTYSPGGASPPRELALYQNLTDMIFGAKVTVSWSVTGNPRDCEYYQDETGSFSIFNGPGFQKTTKGQNNRMPRAYTDYMGATVPMIPPPPTATYHLQTKWRVMFRCVSSTQDRHVVQRVDSADWDQDFTYP